MFLRRVLFLLPFLGFWGCKPHQELAPNSSDTPIPNAASASRRFPSPQDDLGRDIALKSPAKRVVVIGPGAIETVWALGAQKSLVGRDDYADFPPETKKIAVAGNYSGPGVEKCIALRPDLVLLQGETWDRARVDSWQNQIGVPVAALTANSLAAVRHDFQKMGVWLGRSKEAAKLAQSLKIAVPRGAGQTRAFFEVGRAPLYSAGQGTLIDDVMRTGGLQNIASDVKGYQPFGVESLLSRAPDVYIATSNPQNPPAKVLRDLRAEPSLSKLKCVREGKIIVINSDWLLRPGPRLRLGILALQRAAK